MSERIRIGALQLRFLQAGEANGGSLDLFEMTVPPNARMPLPHYHRTWDETIVGLSGTSTWTLSGEPHHLGPGESLFVRRGVVHGFDNRTAEPAVCLCIITPGVLGPAYFREMAALAAAGPPDPDAMRAVMSRYGLVPAGGA